MPLEVGALTEVVTVASQVEIIQTETGAREGVISAEQIENLSLVGRSSLELLRMMPGVVAPGHDGVRSVSFGGGANNTQAYTVNGIRSSANTVSLDGSSLIDIGANSGLIVTLNNDMVQEVKVQSSNFAAEYGSGGMSVSAVTKAGSSRFHGALYDYIRHSNVPGERSLELDRRRRQAEEQVPVPRRQHRRSGAHPGPASTRTATSCSSSSASRSQRQKVDPGSRFGVVPTLLQRQGDFTRVPDRERAEPGPARRPGAASRRGFPGAGTPAPGANLAPYIHPLGRALANLYPEPNYSIRTTATTTSSARCSRQNRNDLKMRFDYNISNNTKAYVRIAREGEDGRQRARRVVGRFGSRAAVAEPRQEQRPLGTPATSSRC